MVRFVVFAGLVSGLLSMMGCKGEEGPAGPSLSGAIMGNVVLADSLGNPKSNHSGASVWIEGATDTVMTDSTGYWRLTGVRTGIYTIVMRKAGYGHMKLPSTQFVGGGNLYVGKVSLVAGPSYVLQGVGAVIGVATPSLTVNGSTATHSTVTRSVVIYIGHEPVDPYRPVTYIDTLRAIILNTNDIFNSRTILTRNAPWNFAEGDTAFILVYPVSPGYRGYIDPESGRQVFSTGISESGIARKWRMY